MCVSIYIMHNGMPIIAHLEGIGTMRRICGCTIADHKSNFISNTGERVRTRTVIVLQLSGIGRIAIITPYGSLIIERLQPHAAWDRRAEPKSMVLIASADGSVRAIDRIFPAAADRCHNWGGIGIVPD